MVAAMTARTTTDQVATQHKSPTEKENEDENRALLSPTTINLIGMPGWVNYFEGGRQIDWPVVR